MRLTARYLSWLWLAVGLAILVWVLQGLKLRQMGEALLQIRWWALLLIPLSFLWIIPNTLGWDYSFKSPGSRVPFSKLLMVRIAGESINDLLPSSNLGGEPIKAMLLRPSVTFAEGLSSVTVAKTTQTLSIVIFLVVGFSIAALHASLPNELVLAALGAIVMLGGGVVVLTLGSSSGLLSRWAHYGLRRWPNTQWLAPWLVHILEMDACLSAFYRKEKRRFIASTLWHLLGLILGCVELYAIGRLLGVSLSLTGALIVEAVATLAAVGGFLIPGSIGIFEFGHYIAGPIVGISPASGVIMSLIRRFRELFWLLAGLILLYFSFPNRWKAENRIPAESAAPAPIEI